MKNYVKPNVQISKFVSEDVVTTSCVNNTNPLIAKTSISFANSHANVSWNDKVSR